VVSNGCEATRLDERADFVHELASKHIVSTTASAPTQQLLEDRRTRPPVPEQARDPTQARTTGSPRRLRIGFAEPFIFSHPPARLVVLWRALLAAAEGAARMPWRALQAAGGDGAQRAWVEPTWARSSSKPARTCVPRVPVCGR